MARAVIFLGVLSLGLAIAVPASAQNQNGGYIAFESFDGSMLYYTKPVSSSFSLWEMRVGGGQETELVKSSKPGFTLAKKGIYFEQPNNDGSTSIRFLHLGTGKVTVVNRGSPGASTFLSISPDERYLLYSQLDQRGSDLMLVENFR